MAIVTQTQLENASADVQTLEDVVNGAADFGGDGLVTNRLGHDLKTLAKIEEEINTTGTGWLALAQDWATKTNGNVDGSEYSAKAYALGGTGVTNTAGKGASKEWAIETGSSVDTSEYSAKEYAVGTQRRGLASGGSAKDWATYTGGTVDNTDYSAKYHAQAAATSAASAAAALSAGLYETIINLTFASSPYIPLIANEGALYKVDTSGGNVVINLSALSTYNQNVKWAFVKTTADANTVTINRGGTNTINGANSVVLSTQYEVHGLIGELAAGTWTDVVQSTGIADNAITTAKILNGAVTASKMAAPASLNNAGTAGGTANAQTLTPTPALGAYAAGDMRNFLPVASNTSGTVTVNVSGLGTRNIKKFFGSTVVDLAVNDIIINQPALIIDDGTQYILMNPKTYTQGADIASAGTVNLSTATGDYINVTGTTTITAITLAQGIERTVKFAGILTLTNGASLILPSGANITTAAGDVAVFRGEASGVVRCLWYSKANGQAVVGGTGAGLTHVGSSPYTTTGSPSITVSSISGGNDLVIDFTTVSPSVATRALLIKPTVGGSTTATVSTAKIAKPETGGSSMGNAGDAKTGVTSVLDRDMSIAAGDTVTGSLTIYDYSSSSPVKRGSGSIRNNTAGSTIFFEFIIANASAIDGLLIEWGNGTNETGQGATNFDGTPTINVRTRI